MFSQNGICMEGQEHDPLCAQSAVLYSESLSLIPVNADGAASVISPLNKENLLSSLRYVVPILESRKKNSDVIIDMLQNLQALELEYSTLKDNLSVSSFSASSLKREANQKRLSSKKDRIEQKKIEIYEFTGHNFSSIDDLLEISSYHYYIKAKKADKETYKQILKFYNDILRSENLEDCQRSTDYLYAFLSTFNKQIDKISLEDSQRLKASKSVDDYAFDDAFYSVSGGQGSKFRDTEYYDIILKMIRPYSSEQAKMFSSFFIKGERGKIYNDWNIYTSKYDKFFKYISVLKGNAYLFERSLQPIIENDSAIEATGQYFSEFFRINSDWVSFSDLRDSQLPAFNASPQGRYLFVYESFKAHFDTLSDMFLEIKRKTTSVNADLLSLLNEYERKLDQCGVTTKPTFIASCQKILNQPDFDPLANGEEDGRDLSIDEKLAQLHIVDDLEEISKDGTCSFKEDISVDEKAVRHEEFKKLSVAEKESLDESVLVIEASSAAAGSVDASVEKSVVMRMYRRDRVGNGASRGTSKVFYGEAKAEPYRKGKGLKEAAISADSAAAKKLDSSRTEYAVSSASLERESWLTELMEAHEYNFKDTIKTVYNALFAKGLDPFFDRRNEKFVFSFKSRVTDEFVAITHDVPHGSQLRKGNAAGWIKTIKSYLKEHYICG